MAKNLSKKRVPAKRPLELGVLEAAQQLGVSPRMLRVYIEEKRIQALKVGRKWFVDAVSLEAFRQRMHFPQSPIPNPQSPIPNPQSPIPNPQSPIVMGGRMESLRGKAHLKI